MWVADRALGDEERLDAERARRVVRRAAALLRPHAGVAGLGAGLVVLWTATTLATPVLVRHGIDAGAVAGDGGALTAAVVGALVVAVVSYAAYRGLVAAVNRAGELFLRDLRTRVFDHLQALSLSFYEREKAGVVVARMTADVESLSELVQTGLILFLSNGLLVVGTLVVLFALSWPLALIGLVGVPAVALATRWFQRESNAAYLIVRDRVGATLAAMQEGLAGTRVVQAFAREDAEVQRFRRRNEQLFDAHMASVRIAVWYFPVVELAGIAGTAAVVGVGGLLAGEGVVTVGTIAAFVLLLGNLFEPVQQLSQLLNMLQSAGAALDKLFGLLDTPVEVAERPGAVDLPPGAVVLEGVGFAYPGGAPVLHGVDLAVQPGERLAVVGPTGAGKSTLAKLVARFYDPSEGRVTVGGVDLRQATLRSLRQRIVVVPQEGFLFRGSIADNVRVGRPDAGDDEVERALDAVGALERFAAFPDGLATEVQARGARLSAGERQLVSLARAALADPDVLVLDEATSSLDPGTEAAVEEAVERLTAGRTTVVIAHRLTTAARADRVVVVVGGRVVQVGPHHALVAAAGPYADLHQAWVAGRAPDQGRPAPAGPG